MKSSFKKLLLGIVLVLAAIGATKNARPQGIPINCADSGGQHLNYLTATHRWICGTTSSGSGGAALSAITAATGPNTIASGNNTAQIWNWANTTDSTIAFTFGETSAGTGGTSTSGVPNQVLLKISTLATSTQSPLSVYSRAAHVFSVSPSAPQILATDGTASNPSYGFASSVNSGMALVSNSLKFYTGGTNQLTVNSGNYVQVNTGSASSPGLRDISNNSTGLFWGLNILGIADTTDGEWCRYISRIFQCSRGSADATAYAINVRKSRGTVASPTVITTADTLSTISGYGYVGGTNTYLEATRIASVSTGTITDATTGIGGYLGFFTSLQGTSTTPVEGLRLDSNSHLNHLAGVQTAAPTVTAACGTSPTVTGNDSVFVLNVGTGGTATTCTVTFNKGFTNTPHCFAQDQTSQAVTTTAVPSTSTVVISSTAAWTASSKIDVLCVGHL